MKKQSSTISVQAGKIEFVRKNSIHLGWRDLYRNILSLTWPRFLLAVLAVYLLLNLLFATAFTLGGPCLAEVPQGSFPGAFFYSVQTLSTVGYGHVYPKTAYGDIVTTLEIMVGMFFTAAITGLIFVRFSRPVAQLLFSDHLVICHYNGMPTLQFRVANLYHQTMVDAEFRLMMVRKEAIDDEEDARRFHTLKLEYDRLILFPTALTIRHVIDETSPLFGVTPASLESSASRFMASIVCVDTVIPASVHSEADYLWSDVRFDHRFVEIYHEHPDGRMEVDYGRVHETELHPKRLFRLEK
ncbi:hypothetical protein JIN85_03215 [Luteolibacter pohnpeiensis]|uniref:ATP-sensitive inward rectifier potassium channel 10 n=1 Tax=Luteolibacter pohnpeiensis TaxID=454153 RepID=A0A934S8P5_9BACT|nr:ion channel [Luteolibacter pohnpeiensis]MBK1881409.1 hypothetical protein [Luteolibacter pohnpeiensis]